MNYSKVIAEIRTKTPNQMAEETQKEQNQKAALVTQDDAEQKDWLLHPRSQLVLRLLENEYDRALSVAVENCDTATMIEVRILTKVKNLILKGTYVTRS